MSYNHHEDDPPPERDEYQEAVDEQLTKDAIYKDNAPARAEAYLLALCSLRQDLAMLWAASMESIRKIDNILSKHENK